MVALHFVVYMGGAVFWVLLALLLGADIWARRWYIAGSMLSLVMTAVFALLAMLSFLSDADTRRAG